MVKSIGPMAIEVAGQIYEFPEADFTFNFNSSFQPALVGQTENELLFPYYYKEMGVKWSGKFGRRAKMYPTRTNGYENDKATELFRPV